MRTSGARAACTGSPAACSSVSARRGCSTRCSTSRSILGLALGCGVSGLLPVPEIQYLAYLHNAEDQLRGEAASLRFFSNGTFTQPDGRAHRRARLPEGLRRSLPQRQRGRRAARHPRPGRRRAVPPRGRRPDAAQPAWPPRSPTARSASTSSRSRCTTSAICTTPATAAGWAATPPPTSTSRSAAPAPTGTAPTSPSSRSATACG